jgi:integrase
MAPSSPANNNELYLVQPQDNLSAATPVRRTGKSMSRRTGQNGHLEPKGKYWVVRWWQDEPGQEKRIHRSAKVCPISGPGSLTKSNRVHRAREIIRSSGADTEELFNQVVRQTQACVTFGEQSETWYDTETTRIRKPVSTATKDWWRDILDNWLIPHLGDLPVSEVNHRTVKPLVRTMVEKELSPKTIQSYVGVIKSVVAAVVNEDGEEIYPRKWSSKLLDTPVVEESEQNKPAFTSDVMTGLAKYGHLMMRVLFILCGAAGLRIGEALGIDIAKHISSDFRTLQIKQKVRKGKIEDRLKTKASYRKVDLDPCVAALLKAFVGNRKTGLLFQSRNGTPLSLTNILRRHLHPALLKLGFVNEFTDDHKAGTHAFRRFRNTYLRNRTECPEGIRDYWLAWEMDSDDSEMSKHYDAIHGDEATRLEWAEKCGIGFEFPPVVPIVPKTEVIDEPKKAA